MRCPEHDSLSKIQVFLQWEQRIIVGDPTVLEDIKIAPKPLQQEFMDRLSPELKLLLTL